MTQLARRPALRTESRPTTRTTALHVVGQSDLGFTGSGREVTDELQAGRLAELLAMNPQEQDRALAGTPLSHFVAGLRAGTAGATTDVVLLATTSGGRSTKPIATAVEGHVSRASGAATVNVEEVTLPSSDLAGAWLKEYTARHDLDEHMSWALHVGAGSTGLLLGVLFELLLAGAHVTLRAEDADALDISLDASRSRQTLLRWLVRHRFYDVLAPLDPVWVPLARRQAVDVGWLLEQHCGPASDDRTWPLDDQARAVLFDAVQAAFAEGLARREITDGAAARTWLRRLAATAPDAWRDDVLLMLGCVPGRRLPVDGSRFAGAVGEPLASLLRQDVADWHEDVKRLSHGQLDAVPEPPPAVLEQQHDWLRSQHEQFPLVHYPVWPLVEPAPTARHVLLLRVSPVARDERSQRANDDEVDRVVEHLDAGKVTLVELTTPSALSTTPHDRIHGPLRIEVDDPDVEVRPSLAGAYRDKVTRFLAGVPELDLVDDVAVVVPKGPKALVTAAVLAAVDFSLHAAVPVRTVDLVGLHGGRGPTAIARVTEDSRRPLASLGLDGMLANLAATAVGNLDLTVAEQLLRRGSARLSDLARAVADLRRDAFGVPDAEPGTPGQADRTSRAEILLACARLRLCGTLADRHPWDAAYLASSVLDHTFRMPLTRDLNGCAVVGVGQAYFVTKGPGWVVGARDRARQPQPYVHLAPWQKVRVAQPLSASPCSALRDWRNAHPLSHGIDQPWENQHKPLDQRRERITTPTSDAVVDLVARAETELRDALVRSYPWFSQDEPDPRTLVRRHTDLADRLPDVATPLPDKAG